MPITKREANGEREGSKQGAKSKRGAKKRPEKIERDTG
jgi:hypothetical protein